MIPTAELAYRARFLVSQMAKKVPHFSLIDQKRKETVPLPAEIGELIVEVLEALADNRPVSIVALDKELTTTEAAELLQVSRTHVVGLIDEGLIVSRKVGTHRRLRLTDVMTYRNKMYDI